MAKAIEHVRTGTIRYTVAARMYNVPVSTLYILSKKVGLPEDIVKRRPGRPPGSKSRPTI